MSLDPTLLPYLREKLSEEFPELCFTYQCHSDHLRVYTELPTKMVVTCAVVPGNLPWSTLASNLCREFTQWWSLSDTGYKFLSDPQRILDALGIVAEVKRTKDTHAD